VKSTFERRDNTRLLKKFQATIKIPRADAEIDGVTENLSQGGAFISSRYLPFFQENDEAKEIWNSRAVPKSTEGI
jgi:hypothetical protein